MKKLIPMLLLALTSVLGSSAPVLADSPWAEVIRQAVMASEDAKLILGTLGCESTARVADYVAHRHIPDHTPEGFAVISDLGMLDRLAEGVRMQSTGSSRDGAMTVRGLILGYKFEVIEALRLRMRYCRIQTPIDNGVEK